MSDFLKPKSEAEQAQEARDDAAQALIWNRLLAVAGIGGTIGLAAIEAFLAQFPTHAEWVNTMNTTLVFAPALFAGFEIQQAIKHQKQVGEK